MNKDKHIPQGYKDSPLGIIPKEWEVKRLGDVCKISVGRDVQIDHFKETKTDKFRYPVYSNTVEEKGLYGYYDYEEYCSGAVTVVGRGVGLGTSFARDRGFGAIGRLVVLHPHNCLRNHFLENYINNEVKFFVESAAIPQLTGEQIATYKILIPPLSQQEKMENYINHWDTAIEKQSELIEKLTLRKRALMQQLLTGKKRLPGFSGEWKHVPIKSFANELSNRNIDGINYIVLSCTKYDGLVPSLKYFGKQIYSNDLSSYKIIPQGHFAYATNHIEEGSIGYQSNYENGLISPMYTVFSTDNKMVDDTFLFAVLKSHHLIYLYKSMMEGSINRRGGLRWDSFSTIKIDLPPLREQKAISAFLKDADKEIELANKKLNNLQSQKRGLMQQLLTGRKRIIG